MITKKEHFYNTALLLIHEKGFKAMTMRDLATRLSCDIKNLYNYTSSKAALLEDLLFGISNDFHEGLNHILETDITPTQQLEELIRLHVELSYAKPLQVGLLISDWKSLNDPIEFVKKRDEYENKVSTILKKGVNKGEFRKINIEIATQYLLGSLRWQYTYNINNNLKKNPLADTEELKKLIIQGLIPQ